jgi:hypothetical protein
MMTAHLSDDRLVELYFTETPSAQEQQHLGACAECDAKRSSMAHLLEETALVAEEELEAAFPAERLARQQARILERVDAAGGPARVIAFPAAHVSTPGVISRTSSTTRWIAAAAVAGLVVGIVAGRAGRETPGSATARMVAPPLAQSISPAVRTVSSTLSDDEFLRELDTAIESRHSGALRALDELTPRAWER